MSTSEKRCTRCKRLKHLSDFYPDRRVVTGTYARCKSCCLEVQHASSRMERSVLREHIIAERRKPVDGKIPLTRGFFAEVDPEDLVRLSAFSWRVSIKRRKPVAACRRIRLSNGAGGVRYMATEIMGENPGKVIDHWDRNPLNNRRSNLRWATSLQNSRNRMCPNRTGYKGVYRNKRSGRFRATIWITKKQIWLGSFPTARQAAQAYNSAAIRDFGTFACLNKVEGD